MSEEVIGLDLEIRLEGAQSVAELKQILKDAKNEAIKFGEGTPQFDKFTKVAAKAADTIGDLNDGIKALDPGSKAAAFQALGSTIVGGMQAATGALAVFSGDNEQLNAILLKSMAIVQGLQGIQAIADAKKQLGFVKNILGIKSETAATQALAGATTAQATASGVATGAAKVLRGALIATGVGALVVAVGLLIANFDKVKKVVTDLFPVLNNLGAITDKVQGYLNGLWEGFKKTFSNIGEGISLILQGNFKAAFAKITDFQSIGTAAAKGYADQMQSIADDAAKAELAKVIENNKRKLAVMEAAGQETYAFKRKILKDELSLLTQSNDEEIAAYKDKQNEIAVLDASHKKSLADAAQVAKEKRLKEIEEEDKKIFAAIHAETEAYWKAEEEKEKLLAERLELEKKNAQEIAEAQMEADKKSQAAYDKSQEERKTKAQATQEAMFTIAQMGANGIIAIGQLMTNNAKKQETYNKIAAGIQIGIDTARGIMSAVAAAKGLTGFDYVAQVAVGVGTVLANAVKAKQLLSKVGGSAPSMDTSTLSSAQQSAQQSAPSFNPSNQRTTLEEAERRRESGRQGNSIFRAYVVETEMSESQKRVAKLEDRSAE